MSPPNRETPNPKLKSAEYDTDTPAMTSQEATQLVNDKMNEEDT